MPKDTFHNLNPIKKQSIIDAFLEEFSTKTYEDASISAVVKSLGIAKGSVYQYFTDKLDLYLYLKSICEKIKLGYIMHLRREDFPDFWAYFRAMYEEGVKFDLEHTLASRFLVAIGKNEHSPTMKNYINEWRDQARTMFEQMIQTEVDQGHFRKDVPVKTMAFFLVSTSMSIGEYMQALYDVDFDRPRSKGQAVFADQSTILLKSVDHFILLLQKAFDQ